MVAALICCFGWSDWQAQTQQLSLLTGNCLLWDKNWLSVCVKRFQCFIDFGCDDKNHFFNDYSWILLEGVSEQRHACGLAQSLDHSWKKIRHQNKFTISEFRPVLAAGLHEWPVQERVSNQDPNKELSYRQCSVSECHVETGCTCKDWLVSSFHLRIFVQPASENSSLIVLLTNHQQLSLECLSRLS